jgi:predicted small metal-binding protein
VRYDFHCVDAGAPSCRGHVKADSEEELRAKLTEHLKKHDVHEPNDTLLDHLVAVAGPEAER